LRRKNVTVSAALTASPITAPVVPLIPLGRSTAMHAGAVAFMASIIARATPSTGRSRPAPNSASTTDVGRHQALGCRRAQGPGPALRRRGCVALEPLAVADEQQSDPVPAFGQQAGRDEAVAAVVARPRHHGDARARRMPRRDVSATARPAFSINVMPTTPPAIVRRSASAISPVVRISLIARHIMPPLPQARYPAQFRMRVARDTCL
jgi:hypothetical protein